MGWLEDRVALITGGGSGIGRAVVERFIAEGARVGVLELVEEKAQELRDELGEQVVVVQGDASRREANERAVRETVNAFGKLDVLVGNAGIYDFGVPLAELPVDKLETAFDETFGINVKGYMLAARLALPELLKTQGAMIFTASYASFHAAGGGVLYTASKHAVLGLIRQLAYELAPKVRVNGVAPGIAPTAMRGVRTLGQEPHSALLEGTEKVLPLQFMPDAADHAAAYVYLASAENSRAVTGMVIETDSGLAIRGLAQPAGGLNL